MSNMLGKNSDVYFELQDLYISILANLLPRVTRLCNGAKREKKVIVMAP